MMQGRILVTGATGFLGGALSRHLLAEGARVIATGRDRERLDALAGAGAETVQFDLTAGVRPEISACEAVVHCAALSSPWGQWRDFAAANIDGTKAALELARAAGAKRFVHISTPSLYFRFADQIGVRETDPLPPPVNAYAKSKLMAEQIVLDAQDLDPIILRPRGLYGAGDTALLPRLIRTAKTRALPLMRDGIAATDLTHIDDVVSAIMAALRVTPNADARVFNVSGGVALPIRDVVDAACAKAGVEARWRPVPVWLANAYARTGEAIARMMPSMPEPPVTAYSVGLFAFQQTLDISAAEAHLGWTPNVSFKEGLERTFAGAALS